MSEEKSEFYDSFLRDRPFDDDLSSIFRHRSGAVDRNEQDPLSVEPLSARYMSFADYLHGPSDYNSLMRAFDMPCASSDHELLFQRNHDGGSNMTAPSVGNENPVTPNSSISSSSAEVVVEEDSGRCKNDLQKKDKVRKQQQQPKEGEDGGDKSKKVSKPRKQGEKRQKVPRFAFMTKSEVDHLEDGYRWRKYGQKAVKNSPYPRGYYRCTTQKCPVKKRVERSKEDPTVVITTYEGQHTHHSPATIRSGSHLLAPPLANSSSFHHDLLMLNQLSDNGHQGDTDSRIYLQSRASTPHQHLQLPDYGLLQDVIPSFIN